MITKQCAFEIGERRCRCVGVAAHTTKATSSTRWYCTTHLNDKRGGLDGLALMDANDRDFAERMLQQVKP